MVDVNRAAEQSPLRAMALAAALLVACSDEVVPSPYDASAMSSKDGAEVQDHEVDTADAASEAAPEVGSPDVSNPVDSSTLAAPDPTIALAAESPSCLECATDNCSSYIDGCASVAGPAAQGPAASTPKSALCVETLACVLSTGCASCTDPAGGCTPLAKFGSCYCRWDDPIVRRVPSFCTPPLPSLAGPCRSALERSLETTDSSALLSSFSDTSKGGSWAMLLMQCLVDNGCTTCFPPPLDAAAETGAMD